MLDTQVRASVSAMMPEILADLERLVAIPSVAFPGYPPDPVNEMAAETLEMFRSAGVTDAPCWRCRAGTHRCTRRSAVRRDRRS
jgi:hypothetical protein